MRLDVDKVNMTIMGVRFTNKQEFRGVWYVLSSSMIEGWQPSVKDVEEMKSYISNKRLELKNV
ncbi:hypothetical protein [Pseudolactococcus laudensis]|uniref:Uncharacterized protein n=1 Tax=Pseudolactococcus laudensis TaxID=1494461 RepID=A0A7V8N0P9_9LACT|nr:hypothetical protein [Lactococcus laudensis]MBA0016597.1 hypothetical protein [Lactococcus laudensis]MBW9281302.1 hypothetical protein [Lactococcus laudensis]CCK18821.1 hypothetical protein BN193_01225 [Lactococcus raffinolactis 4877]